MNPPRYRLRAACDSDFDFMMRVGHEGLRPHVETLEGWNQAAHERAFRATFDLASMQVIVCDGAPVGYVQLLEETDRCLLGGLYLEAAWRGRGLGGALLASLCGTADARGRRLRLRVHRGNPARRLYLRHGFVVSGESAGQYGMTREAVTQATPMARIIANHHVLAVPDAERSAAYSVDALGFRLLPVEDEGWRFVRRDNVMLMLGSCPDAIPPSELGDHSYFAYLVVDDVDACYARFRAAGALTSAAPADKPWRMREFPLRTPDGHLLMVGEDMDAP